MARRTLLLIASILVAALGTALVWLYVQGADQRAKQGASLVKVFLLHGDAAAGENALSLALVAREVPSDTAPNAVTDRQELVGKVLKITALDEQVLLRTMLSTRTAEAARFPQGGAVALSITDPNRVPADLQPGDVVDVYSLGRGAGAQTPVVKGIRVRTIGGLAQPGTGDPGTNTGTATGSIPPTIIGFDATEDQAKALYGAVAAGQQIALYDRGTGPAGNTS
jgi:pilus assembly protein CpaB